MERLQREKEAQALLFAFKVLRTSSPTSLLIPPRNVVALVVKMVQVSPSPLKDKSIKCIGLI